MYGNTNTAHALRRARTEMFTVPAGDRPGNMFWHNNNTNTTLCFMRNEYFIHIVTPDVLVK